MKITGKIYPAIKITRPVNVGITFISVIIAGMICSRQKDFAYQIILAAIAGALVTAAGNIINDVIDIKTDILNNKKDRVLPSGQLSIKEAVILYEVTSAFAFLCAIFINTPALLVVIITSIILYFYSSYLKTVPLAGNLTVALLTAMAFVFGGIAVKNISGTMIPALYAFLINLMREIIKDIQDMPGDARSGFLTFPIKYGVKASRNLVAGLIGITVFIPFFAGKFTEFNPPFYLILFLIVNPLFVFILGYLFINNLNKNLVKISNILKINMVIGLIAIILGV